MANRKEQLEKLRKMATLLEQDKITEKQFSANINRIVQAVETLKTKLSRQDAANEQKIDQVSQELRSLVGNKDSELRDRVSTVQDRVESILGEFKRVSNKNKREIEKKLKDLKNKDVKIKAEDVTSGKFRSERISLESVKQHERKLEISKDQIPDLQEIDLGSIHDTMFAFQDEVDRIESSIPEPQPRYLYDAGEGLTTRSYNIDDKRIIELNVDESIRNQAKQIETGESVINGDNNAVLHVDGSGNLSTDTNFTWDGSALGVDGSAVFNESGADADFRVEGSTDPNALFVDASTDRVGIGTSTPDSTFDVAGDAYISGTTTTNRFTLGTDSITDITGAGLSISSDALTLTNDSLEITAGTGLSGGGNVALGTTTTLNLSAALGDLTNVATSSTQTNDLLSYDGTNWTNVATSTLGLGDGTFTGLSDTQNTLTANRVPYTNAAGDALTDSSNLTFDGSALDIDGTLKVYDESNSWVNIGKDNTLSGGTDNIAVGVGNEASGDSRGTGRSFAFGSTNTASAFSSFALGRSNTASGSRSSAFGYLNTASGSRSSASGYSNTASGDYSSAFGFNTAASSTGASVFGGGGDGINELVNETQNSTLLGPSTGNTLHLIHNDSARLSVNGSERFRVDANGNVGIGTTTPNAKLQVDGSISSTTETITTTTDTLDATNHIVLADDDTAGASMTLTLPAASGNNGLQYIIKKIGTTANVVIDGSGTETIDGATTSTLTTQYESITIVCNGSNWFII